jgi:hypothetical protein
MFDDEDEDRIDYALGKWAEEVAATLPNVENNLLRSKNLPTVQWERRSLSIQTPQLMAIYNWKVWCSRYHVNLETLLTIIFSAYQYCRRNIKPPCLSFGVSTALITGVACRQRVEEEIFKMYPNGENYTADLTVQPVMSLNYENLDDMVDQYNQLMHQHHVDVATKKQSYRRAFRR